MQLEFLKLKKENIFCEDFIDMNKNNIIDFTNTNINVLYAPNGVGKSSFCKVLDNQGEFIINYDGNQYSTNNCNLFHIINDQNSRNIIKGKAQDFLLGDNIAREYELKEWIDDKFDDIYKDLRLSLKNNMNLSKISDNKFSWIDHSLHNILKKIVNVRAKSTDINLDDYIHLIQKLKEEKLDEHNADKFKYVISDENFEIINRIVRISNIKESNDFSKIEQYDDAIIILNKYNELSNCIVCDNDNINSKELLEKKNIKKAEIINNLDDDTKNILIEIINRIGETDPFNIKNTLTRAISSGSIDIVSNLIKEIEMYINIYKSLINNLLSSSLSKEFVDKYTEYKEMLIKELNITDEDLMFIEEFIEKNINKSIKLQRADNRIVITLDSEDLIGVARENLKLSSGEQNFISLTFELLKAKNVENEIIVIDDPISSFDSIFKNKLVYAIVKFLIKKKVIILTHNVDLIRLIEYQNNNNFNIYLFNNFDGQENGFIEVNHNEKMLLISIPDFLDFIRSNKIIEFVKDEKLYIYSLIPFMRGYVKYIGNQVIKNQLTKLMHGYETEHVDLGQIYYSLFNNNLSNNYTINISDILSLDICNLNEIIDKNEYPILNKVLCNNLTYLYLRLKTEKILVDKFSINTTKYDQLSSIIFQSFKEETIENSRMRIFFYSKKTLLNEFNHFEGNVNIFQPAIDISENILIKERNEILDKLNNL